MTARNVTGARWLPVPVADFGRWQALLLEESAGRAGVVLSGEGRVHRRHSAGSPVTFRGERAWLRVSPFLAHEMNSSAWEGTAEATAITGMSMAANDQAAGGQPFMITAADRLHRFGMKHDGYEAHAMLSRLGLVEVTPDGRRRPDGTVEEFNSGGNRFPTCSDLPQTASAATPSPRSARSSTVGSALPPSSPTEDSRQRARTRHHTGPAHAGRALRYVPHMFATQSTCSRHAAQA